LCLQETKLSINENIFQLFDKVYALVSINNSKKKGSSGTASYSNIKTNKENFCFDVDAENDGRIIEQHYNNLVLFNVYFPNGKVNASRLSVKIKFYENFLIYCEKLRISGKSIIVCGDFNTAHREIDLKKTKITDKSGFSDKERACFDMFIQKGYLDTYRHIHGDKEDAYTWWSYRSRGRAKNEGWRIDYILISNDLKDDLQDAFILDEIDGSDHCPIGIRIDLSRVL
jgi:exodeoxyribonuclease-3